MQASLAGKKLTQPCKQHNFTCQALDVSHFTCLGLWAYMASCCALATRQGDRAMSGCSAALAACTTALGPAALQARMITTCLAPALWALPRPVWPMPTPAGGEGVGMEGPSQASCGQWMGADFRSADHNEGRWPQPGRSETLAGDWSA